MICAEPAPDVALAKAMELTAKRSVPQKGDVELQGKLETEVIQLAGRTQIVLFLRESMYRLCEQAANGFLTPAELNVLYGRVLETGVELAKATTEASVAAQKQAPAAEAVAEAEKLKAAAAETTEFTEPLRTLKSLSDVDPSALDRIMLRQKSLDQPDE